MMSEHQVVIIKEAQDIKDLVKKEKEDKKDKVKLHSKLISKIHFHQPF